MSKRETYEPGPATGATIQKSGDTWTLVLVRDLRHPPAKVWRALTDPAELAAWAPFDADRSLAATGTAKLTVVGAPKPQVFESTIKRAEAPKLLEYTWAGAELRWELEPTSGGTRLTLWHAIDRNYIAWGAAGWHLCIDVLELLVGGDPIGRIVGADAMGFAGWQRLVGEYSKLLDVAVPSWQPMSGS